MGSRFMGEREMKTERFEDIGQDIQDLQDTLKKEKEKTFYILLILLILSEKE